jgi:multiple sugar transport system ATP-binding protein
VTHDQIEAMTLADRIVIMEKGAIQQIGTPDEIYNDPENTFVAGFIGAPPMNLIPGHIAGGVFTAPGVEVTGLPAHHSGTVTLGVRPEDCQVSEGQAHLTGQVYGVEPTGDMTFLTLKVGEKLIEVKADRDYRADLNAPESVAFDETRIYLFDTDSGQRLR